MADNVYEAAVAYIRLSDIMRVFDHIDQKPSLVMTEHLNQARARLDEVLPSRTWRKWTSHTTVHRISIVPAQKMDTPGLVAALCSCGYVSAPTTDAKACKSGMQHVTSVTCR